MVTAYSQSQPTVLILGDTVSLSTALAHILGERGFAAQICRFADLTKPSVRDHLLQDRYYKIICLRDLAGARTSARELDAILATRREPILFIARFDQTPDQDNDQTRRWYRACRSQYREILRLSEEYPKASLLVVRDLLLADDPYHPAFSYIFRDAGRGLLTDPGLDYHFVSEQSFLRQVESIIFAPYSGEKSLFVAEKISSSRFFHHLEKITARHFQTVSEQYTPVEFSFPFPVGLVGGHSDLEQLTSDYIKPYLSGKNQPTSSSDARPLFPPSKSIKNLTKPTKNTVGSYEPITLPPPRLPRQPQRDPRLDIITLPPALLQKVASSKSSAKKKKSRSSRSILKAVRTTITSQENTVLEQYLQAEKAPATPKVVCKRINVDGINFISCRPTEDKKPTVTISPKVKLQPVIPLRKATPVTIPPINPIKITPFAPSLTSASACPALKPQKPARAKDKKYSKHHIITYKKAKIKNNFFTKLLKSRPFFTSHPLIRRFYLTHPTNRAVISIAIGTALLVVGSYFLVFQPRQNERYVRETLTQYFASCQDSTSCLHSSVLQNASAFSLVKKNALPDLLAALTRLVSRHVRLTAQMDNYYATAWRRETGDVTSELQILEQVLTSSKEQLTAVRTQLERARADLTPLADEHSLAALTSTLDQLEADYKLISDYLPLFAALAGKQDLRLTLLFLDETTARTGGGTILGAANIEFLRGSYQQASFYTTEQLAAASSVQVQLPAVLASEVDNASSSRDGDEKNTTAAEGLANFTFDREFSEVASLLSGDFSSALQTTPDVVVGINLSSLAPLEKLLLGVDDAHTLQQTTLTNSRPEKSLALADLFSSLDLGLDQLAPGRGHEFFRYLLAHLENESFQLYSGDDAIKNAISAAGLRADASSVLCPGGFGSSVCYLDTFALHHNYLTTASDLTYTSAHRIELSSSNTTHTRTVEFVNHSTTDTVSDYLTLALPHSATLATITLDGRDVTLDDENGYKLTLAPEAKATLRLTFNIERAIASSDFTYSYYDQHQNGSLDDQLEVTIVSRVPYSISVIAPRAVTKGETITFLRPGKRSFFGAIDY